MKISLFRSCGLTACICLLGSAIAIKGQSHVYVSNPNGDSVTVVDAVTNTITATIPVCHIPEEVAVNPAGTRVYVPCGTFGTPGTLSVIDTATNTVIKTITSGLDPFSRGAAVSPDGNHVYVTSINLGPYGSPPQTVGVVDASSNSVIATISGFSSPIGIAFSPDGSQVYVANGSANTLSVVNASTLQIVATVSGLGVAPHNIAVSPDGRKVYVGSGFFGGGDSGTVSVIDALTNTLIAAIPCGAPNCTWPAISPDGSRLYVSDGSTNTLIVIDTATNNVVTTVPVGTEPGGVAVSQDGSHVYVACNSSANPAANGLWVINTVTNSVSAKVLFPAGVGAFGIGISKSICPPPSITALAASPNTLWPPNHKMVPVSVSVSTSGGCGAVSCKIISVSSNEPLDSDGDWMITGDLTLSLRAERLGDGNGRVYTITVQCMDRSGNSTYQTVNVDVQHDQGH